MTQEADQGKDNILPISNYKCKRWDADFPLLIAHGALSADRLASFYAHCSGCSYCRDKAIGELSNGLDNTLAQVDSDSDNLPSVEIIAKASPIETPVQPQLFWRYAMVASLAVFATLIMAGCMALYIHYKYNTVNILQTAGQPIIAAPVTSNNTPKSDRYAELEKSFDTFLLSGRVNPVPVKEIAIAILSTGDRYGVDQVDFYINMPSEAVPEIIKARKVCNDFGLSIAKAEFTKYKQLLLDARNVFERYGDIGDKLRAGFYVDLCCQSLSEEQLAEDILNKDQQDIKKYHYSDLDARCLYLEALTTANKSEFSDSIKMLKEVEQRANLLNDRWLWTSSQLIAAGVYFVSNQNQEAYKAAKNVYDTGVGPTQSKAQMLEILAFTAFKVDSVASSDHYFTELIQYCEQNQYWHQLGLTYSLYGVVKAEQKQFHQSHAYFIKAHQYRDNIHDDVMKNHLAFQIAGYEGRAFMLHNEPKAAMACYNQAFAIHKRFPYAQNLALSQLHQGLAECLIAQGDLKRARPELERSVVLFAQAQIAHEENNTLFSFAISGQRPDQELYTIKSLLKR